jgi:Zn-dependent peptidase ImmA (M78 family)
MNSSPYVRGFFFMTLFSIIGLFYITNEKNKFYNNPLSHEIVNKIEQKHLELNQIVFEKYGIKVNVPIYISDTISNNLFGLAASDKRGNIVITLNKNRFKENEQYMIDTVLPHEYAHALMFLFGDFSQENGGHTKKWEEICSTISGKRCERFVQDNDILVEKIGL